MSNNFQQPYALNIPELHIRCAEDKKLCALSHIAQDILDQGQPLSTINSLRVMLDDGWWMVRASDLRPALIVSAQATSEAGLVRLKQNLANHLDEVCLDFPALRL